jgi:hypothetical protein
LGSYPPGTGEFPIQDSRRDHRQFARPGEIVPPMVTMTSGRDATPDADKALSANPRGVKKAGQGQGLGNALWI